MKDEKTSLLSASGVLFSALLILLAIPGLCPAQPVHGAAALGRGETGTAVPDSPWALTVNPALLPTEHRTVSFYTYRYAGFSELTDASAAITLPLPLGAIGFGAFSYGFELFRESRFSAGSSFDLGPVTAGATLTYTHIRQGGGYGSAGALGVTAGLSAEPVPGLIFGFRAVNINQPSLAGSVDDLSRDLAIGLSYRTGPVLLAADAVKDVRFPMSLRFGTEIDLSDAFTLRAGVATEPDVWSAGIGYGVGRVTSSVSVQQHPVLGMSPAVELSLQF